MVACESKLGGDRTCLMLQAKCVPTQHIYITPLLVSGGNLHLLKCFLNITSDFICFSVAAGYTEPFRLFEETERSLFRSYNA